MRQIKFGELSGERAHFNPARAVGGANKQFNAERLVLVTTSSYTAAALEFADKYASHVLTLAGYEQLGEWCESATKEKCTLMKG